MKLILHCQVYWPDNSAVAQLMAAVAEDAVSAGHAVTVVTSAKGYNRDETYPATETHNGVHIVRVGGINFNRHSAFGRMFNYLTFFCLSGLRLLRLPRPDCLIVTSVPPFSLWLGVMAKWLRKSPCVYVIEDLYPDILFASGWMRREGILGRLLHAFFGWWMKRASAMIVLGDHMRARVLASYPQLAPRPIYAVHNWADGKFLYPLPASDGKSDAVVFQYAGNFGKAHDFDTILGAAKRLRDNATVMFEFVGGGKNRDFVAEVIRANDLQHCRVEHYVQQQDQLNACLNRADVCLVTLKPGYEGLIVPSKLYSNMAVGKPALYVGPAEGEIPELIRRHEFGWVVAPGDEQGLVAVIEEAVRNPDLRARYGRNARRAFDEYYERKLATAQYLQVCKDCVEGRATVARAMPRDLELQK